MKQHIKHIVIVAHHYPPHLTGVGSVAHNQAKFLVELGVEVTVVTSKTNTHEVSEVIDGVNVIRVRALNFFEKYDVPFPLFSPYIIAVLLRVIKKADVVHVHDAFYISSFFASVIAWLYKKPLVLTQHVALIAHPSRIVVAIERIVYATTGALIFKLSKSITTYNNSVERFLIGKGVSGRKLMHLTNGVNTTLFHPVGNQEKVAAKAEFGLSTTKKIILFVGRFVPKKGFSKVLAARNSAYQIVMVGGQAIEQNSEEVIYLGTLSPEKLARVYQAADIFVLPSESEGFPLSIQEAMASGLPIVTTDDVGYERYELDRALVCLIDAPTNESVRLAIENLIRDQRKLDAMGAYSEAYAKKYFDWSRSVSQIYQIYEAALLKIPTPRKIAIVSDVVYPYNKGGKEKRLYDITTRLAQRGHDVTIYTMKWWSGEKIIYKDGVTYHAISPHHNLYSHERRSIREAIIFALHAFKLLTKKFDSIEVDHIPHLVLFSMKVVCVIRGKKMIATWHEVWGRAYWNKYLGVFGGLIAFLIEKMSVHLPDQIVSVSEHTTQELRRVLGAKTKIVTIPNGLDIAMVYSHDASPRTSDVVFAGRLLAHKHVDVLVRAVAILKKRKQNVSLIVVGDGPEKQRLEGLTTELGLDDAVSLMGFIEDHRELYRIMRSSKVFVLPSVREGFGITVIEANACGLPVITVDSTYNAAKELIINGENGMVCALDESILADSIEKMLHERKIPDFYMKYSEKYDWENIMPRIEDVYGIALPHYAK